MRISLFADRRRLISVKDHLDLRHRRHAARLTLVKFNTINILFLILIEDINVAPSLGSISALNEAEERSPRVCEDD